MSVRPHILALACLAFLAAGPALAQRVIGENLEARRMAYVEEVRQLAGVLGGAHYLRILCVGRTDQSWRNFMSGMLDREGGARRTDLIEGFNRGYRGQEERFPSCSPAAQTEEKSLRNQGMRLADTLSARLGD
jgi:uncharacterized protein (TIGR02301 family)